MLHKTPSLPRTPTRSRLKRWSLVLTSLLITACLAAVALWFVVTRSPYSMSETPVLEPRRIAEAVAGLESELARITPDHEDTERQWAIEVTREQMHAWLIANLPQQPSIELPGAVQQPRVVLADGQVSLICNFSSNQISSPISLEMQPLVTREPNMVGVRIHRVRAGWLPVPLSKVLWRIIVLVRKSGIRARWDDSGDSATVHVRVNPAETTSQYDIFVEQVDVQDDCLRLAGFTRPRNEDVAPSDMMISAHRFSTSRQRPSVGSSQHSDSVP